MTEAEKFRVGATHAFDEHASKVSDWIADNITADQAEALPDVIKEFSSGYILRFICDDQKTMVSLMGRLALVGMLAMAMHEIGGECEMDPKED